MRSWIDDLGETQAERHRRYMQSSQAEVSDSDEWADIHIGPSSSRAKSSAGSNNEVTTLVSKAMTSVPSAQRDRRVAGERAEALVVRAHANYSTRYSFRRLTAS